MRKNNLLKVLSVAAIASTLSVIDFTPNNTNTNYAYAAETTSKVIEVSAELRHFSEDKPSMGNAALAKVTVQKIGDQYKYSFYWKDLDFNGLKDGVSRFWIDGNEVTLTPTTAVAGDNVKVAEYTTSELKDRINVEVFVQTMENIMQGAGRQKAFFKIDNSAAKTEFSKVETPTTPVAPTQPTRPTNPSTNPGTQPTRPTNPGTRPTRPTTPSVPLEDHKADASSVPANATNLTATGSLKNSKDNSRPSAYGPALEPEIRIEKTSDNNFKYTFKIKPANAMGMNFELEEITYKGNNLDTKTIDTVKKIKEVTLTTSELFDKIQLKASTTYPNGMGKMTHDATLVLENFKKVEDTLKPSVPTTKPSTPAETNKPSQPTNNNSNFNVTAQLMHASQPGKLSMGNAAIDYVQVTKQGDTYHYTVYFKDINFGGQTDGISRFWVNGTEYPVVKTGGANNQARVQFTNKEQLSQVPVSVFVQTMENIMAGGGKQNAILKFNWNGSTSTTPGATTITQPSNNNNNAGQQTGQQISNPASIQEDNTDVTTTSEATNFKGITAALMHASQPGKASMGDAALDGVQVYKQGDTYHYVVYFKDIKFGGQTDGITRFWVNGVEYPVVSTGGANNQVRVHFTSNEKLTQVPVSVFVQTMENIMPGGGKQNAILTFDWSGVSEETIQVTNDKGDGQPGPSGNSGSTALTAKGGRFNNAAGGRLARTGLETSSSIFAGIVTLAGAALLGRKKQK